MHPDRQARSRLQTRGPPPGSPPRVTPAVDPASVSPPGHGVPSTRHPSCQRLVPAVTALGLAPVSFSLCGPAHLLLRMVPGRHLPLVSFKAFDVFSSLTSGEHHANVQPPEGKERAELLFTSFVMARPDGEKLLVHPCASPVPATSVPQLHQGSFQTRLSPRPGPERADLPGIQAGLCPKHRRRNQRLQWDFRASLARLLSRQPRPVPNPSSCTSKHQPGGGGPRNTWKCHLCPGSLLFQGVIPQGARQQGPSQGADSQCSRCEATSPGPGP